MRFHVDIDLPVPRWARNAALILVPVAVVLATTAIVRANVPNVFATGDTLSAQKMNDDFSSLDTRVTTVETKTPLVTAWTSYAPTITAGGVDVTGSATTSAYWRRVGDTLEVNLYTTFSTCAQAGAIAWSLPNGAVPDPAKSAVGAFMGGGAGYGTGTGGTVQPLLVINQGAAVAALDLAGSPGGGAGCAAVGAGGMFRMTFDMPVQGWTVTGP